MVTGRERGLTGEGRRKGRGEEKARRGGQGGAVSAGGPVLAGLCCPLLAYPCHGGAS